MKNSFTTIFTSMVNALAAARMEVYVLLITLARKPMGRYFTDVLLKMVYSSRYPKSALSGSFPRLEHFNLFRKNYSINGSMCLCQSGKGSVTITMSDLLWKV